MKHVILTAVFFSLLLSCTQELRGSNSVHHLADKIVYKDSINKKVFFDGGTFQMILFAMKKEQILEPHTAPMDTSLILLEGSAMISIGKEEHLLYAGDVLILPKEIDHGVNPKTKVKFLLVK